MGFSLVFPRFFTGFPQVFHGFIRTSILFFTIERFFLVSF